VGAQRGREGVELGLGEPLEHREIGQAIEPVVGEEPPVALGVTADVAVAPDIADELDDEQRNGPRALDDPAKRGLRDVDHRAEELAAEPVRGLRIEGAEVVDLAVGGPLTPARVVDLEAGATEHADPDRRAGLGEGRVLQRRDDHVVGEVSVVEDHQERAPRRSPQRLAHGHDHRGAEGARGHGARAEPGGLGRYPVERERDDRPELGAAIAELPGDELLAAVARPLRG
jgi:hypothetical protein